MRQGNLEAPRQRLLLLERGRPALTEPKRTIRARAGQLQAGNTTGRRLLSPWEKRERGDLYYTRSCKVSGRVVREYVGGGALGELAALMDAQELTVAAVAIIY